MMLMLVFSIAFQHAFDNRTDLSELRGRPHRYRQPYFWLEKIVLINGRQPEIVQGIIERVFRACHVVIRTPALYLSS